MFRLTIFLCLGLFVTLQVLGRDTGQKRFGLIEAEREAAVQAEAKAAKLAAQEAEVEPVEVARNDTVLPATPATAPAQPETETVTVAFAPAQVVAPVIAQPVVAEPQAETAALKYVSGRSVNVRGGPSTLDGVVGRLTRGEAVTVLWVEENGWARVRVEGDGIDGYMSMEFLTDTAP